MRFIAGGSELRNAEVEPSLLSLICRELNNARIAQGRAEISADLLAGSHDTILAEFYERALADQPPGVRHFIEDELLTESGFRESIAEERVRKAFAAAGAAPDALATLVDRRLLRIEERLDVRRVELTHDVLCSVVRASRDLRHEREARDEAERKLAEQRARERATRKALVRARQIAAVCARARDRRRRRAPLFGYVSMKRAQRAEAQAQQTRALAESARGEAEKLIVYLLDDFYLELEPVGRLDIVAALAKRARRLLRGAAGGASHAPRPTAIARSRWCATAPRCATSRSSTRARRRCPRRSDVLGKLRSAGRSIRRRPRSGWASGSPRRRAWRPARTRLPEALDLAQPGRGRAEAADGAPTPSIPLRRAYGLATTFLGFSQAATNENEAAVKTLAEARDAYRSIDGLKLDDLPAAVGVRGGVVMADGRAAESRPVRRAEAGWRRRAQGDATGAGTASRRHVGAARRGTDTRHAGGHRMDRTAPAQGAGDEPAGRARLGSDRQARPEQPDRLEQSGRRPDGRWPASVLSLGEVAKRANNCARRSASSRRVKESGMIGNVLSLAAGYLAQLEADAGDRQAAAAALASNQRFVALAIRDRAGGFVRPRVSCRNSWATTVSRGTASATARYALPSPTAITRRCAGSRTRRRSASSRSKTADRTAGASAANATLEVAYRTAADASYRLKDYAAADADIQRALALRKAIPTRTLSDEARRGQPGGACRDDRRAAGANARGAAA